MAEYWKSTPSYWCKFCSQYVRDTTIERKNHEATAKHQNNIQRNLRDLHKNQEREKREKQQAKDEVARLNGMFGGKSDTSKPPTRPPAPKASSSGPQLSTAAQRMAHAEQLAALGIELPDELKKDVTGVGNYKVVTEREVQPAQDGSVSVNRSLADILAESRREAEAAQKKFEDEGGIDATAHGVLKRKAEDDDEDIRNEEAAPKRKAWGSNFKRYPGTKDDEEDPADLDALLSGVSKKKEHAVKAEKSEEGHSLKQEETGEESKAIANVPDVNEPASTKAEESGSAPAVIFKKRKGKK